MTSIKIAQTDSLKRNVIALTLASVLTACGGGSSGGSNTTPTTPTSTTPTNTAPVANAGNNQSVTLGSMVNLSASNSSDADLNTLSYTWTISTAPSSSTATLSSSDNISTSFTPDLTGNYVISLVVNDSTVNSPAVEVTITVNQIVSQNTAPVANAGTNQTVTLNDTVNLNGDLSADANDDPLTYQWTISSQPQGSNTVLANSTTATPNFIATTAGTYTLSLLVNDGTVNSAPNTITITVNDAMANNNITDVEFSNRSGSCADYTGEFFANVKDIQRNLGFEGNITISVQNNKCSFISNEIPNHDFNDATASFANNVATQTGSFQLPITPQMAAQTTALNLGVTNAIMLNGVEVDILPAACYGVGNEVLGREKIGCGPDQINNPWRYDPMSPLNGFGTDVHNAHTQPNGKYHYHGNPMAMFAKNCEASGSASPVIGFAADGFPVYGPCFNDPQTGNVRKATSSYALKNNGGTRQAVSGYTTPVGGTGEIKSNNYDGQFRGDYEYVAANGDLDECNGMTVDGQYGYYITDTFPWILGCYKGAVDASFSNTGMRLKNIMHSHDDEAPHSH